MPNEQMNDQQVASYVHLDLREVRKLASRGQIPCRKVGGQFVFRKGDLDQWIEQHMHTLGRDRLAGIEKGVKTHHGLTEGDVRILDMIPPGGLAVPLEAKTRHAALKSLVALADGAGVVHNAAELLDEIRAREDLCSTALWPEVALPHPRHPLPYDIAESFVVVGLTPSGVPFGGPDGRLTRLFFLVCCKDDRTHLHVLARLAQMLHPDGAIAELLQTDSPGLLLDALRRLESNLASHLTR